MHALAEAAGTTGSTINKLEKGVMRLTTDWMEKIAVALEVQPAELLATHPKADLFDDVNAYQFTERTDPTLVPLSKLPNHVVYFVRSMVLQDLGIEPGDRLLVDKSREAIDAVAPLSAVVANYFEYDDAPDARDQPRALLRQFLPPNKLVTNSSTEPRPEINMAQESAEIIGVVVMHPRDLRQAPTSRSQTTQR